MRRARVWAIVVVALVVAGLASWRIAQMRARPKPVAASPEATAEANRIRAELFAQVQPIALANCQLKRFGEANDGGYLLCGNLLGSVQAGYSYGISGYDGWGCQISTDLKVKVHQYDSFDLTEPVCAGGATVFHGECVAGKAAVDESGRRFDTPEHQFASNGDASHRLVVKMDVEGAEWDTFLESPAQVFEQIDQLVVEFHGVNRQPFIDALSRLDSKEDVSLVAVPGIGSAGLVGAGMNYCANRSLRWPSRWVGLGVGAAGEAMAKVSTI